MSVSTIMKRQGFTLAELIVATAILVLAVSAALGGFVYLLHADRLNSIQTELDVDARKAMEWLRHDLRLSAMDKVVFYPAGPGPYTAISFPMVTTTGTTQTLPYTTNNMIAWNKTVIYHVYTGTPQQLRMTVFSPRNPARTPAELQQQLNTVVESGSGATALDGSNATTRVIFQNLVRWTVHPQRAIFDGYSPSPGRVINRNLGSIITSNGTHYYTFHIIGKNPLSTGCRVGIDTLTITPCQYPREGEAQIATNNPNPALTNIYMAAGDWSGNHYLLYPADATATGTFFTLSMRNDQWEETNFRATGAVTEDTVVEFDTTLTPRDYVVRILPGSQEAWTAERQTLNPSWSSTSGFMLRGAAVRTLLRGGTMMEGGAIRHAARLHCIHFYSAATSPLKIRAAYIAEAADHINYTMDAVDEGIALVVGSGITINPGTYRNIVLPSSPPFFLDKEKSYIVTFLVSSDASQGDARAWTETRTGSGGVPPPVGSWVIPGEYAPDEATSRAASWSAYTNVVAVNRIFAMDHLHTLAATSGVFTSQILDTQLAAPQYIDMTWNAIVPVGTTLRMQVRSGNQPDLSDAPPWTNTTLVPLMSSGGAINPGNGRYVQFQARMTPNNNFFTGSASVPTLRDVTIRWHGENRVTDIAGTFSTGPDHGIFELTMDGKPLVRGVSMDLTIFRNVRLLGGATRQLTSTVTGEIYPRNTGK